MHLSTALVILSFRHYLNLTVMLQNRQKTNYSQNYHLRSFQQSPIYAPSQLDSDRSPEPFLYPTSLQQKNTSKVPRYINLKVQVTNLLTKLKQWLIELCLTQNCVAEVNEQLQPIIEQIIEIGQQQNESYWMQALNCPKVSQNSLKESQNICISSDASDNNKHCSVLVTDSRAEVALLGENEKNLVKLYFKRYYRLLQNSLSRINRCSGEKKLKFLVETVIKSIFSQTLRVSYDLKLVQHRLKQQKEYRMSLNRNGYLRIMSNRIKLIFLDRGNVIEAFKLMKCDYYQGLKRDGVFVNGILKNMDKLCSIYSRNRRWALNKKFYTWREVSSHQKFAEEFLIIDSIHTTLSNILPEIAPNTSCLEQFSHQWRNSIESNINLLLETIFAGQNCIFISLQEIIKQPRFERNLSIIQFLQEKQQLGADTHRSGIYKEHPFLGEFTCEELKNCVLSGQIYRSDRPNNSLLLIPVKPTPGIIFVALSTQPLTSLSFSKRPLSLHSFRILLRIVELLTPLLQEIAQVCKRVQQQWQQTDKQSHYQLFFKQFIKTELICSEGNSQNHLQVNQRGHQFQIDSHRLQYPNEVIQAVIQKFQITNLMVYHITEENCIRELPCLIVGDPELAKLQRHIISSIFLELLNSGKEVLTITRNGRAFSVLPLRKQERIIGFIHYICKNQDKVQNLAITECLVPLILKYEGSINCKQCNIKLALPQKAIQNQVEVLQSERKLSYQDSLRLVLSKDLNDLENNVRNILKNEEYLFQKIIYKLDLADYMTYFYLDDQSYSSLSFFTLPAGEKINHNDIFIEQNSNLKDCGALGKLVQRFPNFENLQLHLYQYQNTHPFRVIALPIKNQGHLFGYLLVGHFLRDVHSQESILIDRLKDISQSMSLNTIFKSTNLHDEKLATELNVQSAEKQLCLQKIQQKIDKLAFHGKFYERLQSLTQYLTTINAQAANFSIFKLNSQNQVNRIACGKQQNKSKPIKITQQCSQILKNCQIMISHEKLYAQSCKLPATKPNRTLRPIKIQKIYETNIFFPKIHSSLKQILLERLKQVFQLQGWICTEHLPLIAELNSQLNQSLLQNDNYYALVNLGKRKEGQMYFLLVEALEPEQNQCIFTNTTALKSLRHKYSEIIYQSFHEMPLQEQKIGAIRKLNEILSLKSSPAPFLRKFKQAFGTTKSKIVKFLSILAGIVAPQVHKNRRYSTLLNQGLIKIKSQSFKTLERYRFFSLNLFPALQKAEYRICLELGFKKILSHIQQACEYNHIRVCSRLEATLSRMVNRKLKASLKQILYYSQFVKTSRQIKRLINTQKIAEVIRFIDYRENKRYFFSQISQFQKSFEDNLSLISLQYTNLRFYSRQQFLKSINQRFNTILKQISYSNIAKIDLFCAQKLVNSTVIYKIGSQNCLSEYIDQQFEESLKERTVFQCFSPTQHGGKHLIVYKIKTKTENMTQKQLNILKKVIEEGIVPCYSRYIDCVQEKTHQLCQIVLRISCKQIFNGSSNESQKVYAFGRGLCLQQQCQKLRVLSRLKSLKKVSKIAQTKSLTNSINQESKSLYNLEYEHNALSGLLSGNLKSLNQEQTKVLDKYGEVITRDTLKNMRQALETLEIQQQKKMLQYQIKSKTFATSKIITFLEKRERGQLEKVSYQYLAGNKQNESLVGNEKMIEKVYVQKRLQLTKIRDLIKDNQRKGQKTAARAIWLCCMQMLKNQQRKRIQSAFRTLFLPKRVPLGRLY